jgi:hypothetical protein
VLHAACARDPTARATVDPAESAASLFDLAGAQAVRGGSERNRTAVEVVREGNRFRSFHFNFPFSSGPNYF